MKKYTRVLSLIIITALTLSFSATALAQQENFTASDSNVDVDPTDSVFNTTGDAPEETVEEPEPTFTDTEGHWGEDEIEAMGELGIVTGDPDGDFRPNDPLNRAEAAALIYRILGLPEPPPVPTESPFTDIENLDDWYVGYIAELKELGMVSGDEEGGTYRPGDNVNRAEFLTMAMNVYYYLADDDTKADIDELMDGPMTDAYVDLLDNVWFTGTVTAATELGFVQGKECDGGKCFDAGAPITRAEATKILYNMFYTLLTT